MKIRRYAFGVLTVAVLGLSACTPAESPAASSATATVEVMEAEAKAQPVEEAVAEEAVAEEVVAEEVVAEDENVARPAWQELPLTNAVTGEAFTLADFAGKTVYVEPFATWCTNCRQQMGHVHGLRSNYGDDVVFLALSVEPNIGDEALAQYAEQYGFDFVYAAMSPELLRELVAVFGQTITNPPATPHFIIRADGTTTEMFTGVDGPEVITSHIAEAQS